ncbi:MAG: nucleotidyl transferase AbiEii/AbiGii toxin family protein [Ignavibacteria bacterium]
MDLNFLTEKTRIVFERLAKEKFLNDYTLVGGTALSIHLQHRLSEDLDFIYDGEILKTDSIKKFIDKTFTKNYKLIKQDNEHQLDFLINEVKVTFFTNSAVMIRFQVKTYSTKYKELNIATIDIIAILKLNAIAHRNTIRDYYDLYFIAKNVLSLKKIFETSKDLLSNLSEISYTESIIYVDDIEEESISDHLAAKENITKHEISDFFTKEVRRNFNK